MDWLLNNELLRLLGVSLGVQWVGCTAAVLLKTEKFYDLTGKFRGLILRVGMYKVHYNFIFFPKPNI